MHLKVIFHTSKHIYLERNFPNIFIQQDSQQFHRLYLSLSLRNDSTWMVTEKKENGES